MTPLLCSPLTFFCLSSLGAGYQNVVVTTNRIVLKEFSRDEAVQAHLLQFSSLYVFGLSYEHDENQKLLPEHIRNFFYFTSIYLWNIRPKFLVRGTQKSKVKKIPPKVKKLWDEIFPKN